MAQPEPLVDVPLPALVEVTPAVVDPGQEVTVTGVGFEADTTVTLTLGSHSATTTADALGRVSAVLQVPAAAGEAVLSASDGSTVGSATLTVREPGGAGHLGATDQSLPLSYVLDGAPAWLSSTATVSSAARRRAGTASRSRSW
ncbi:hypothetical protein ACX1DX_06555 [Tessaracoccus sp. Y36]